MGSTDVFRPVLLSLQAWNGEALCALLCSVLPVPFTLVLWDHMDLSYLKDNRKEVEDRKTYKKELSLEIMN